jgi:hypothetical protein
MPGDYEHSSYKDREGHFKWTPENDNGDFLDSDSNDFDGISVIYGNHLPTYSCIGGTFKKMVSVQGPKREMPILSKPFLLDERISLLFGIQYSKMVYRVAIDFSPKVT